MGSQASPRPASGRSWMDRLALALFIFGLVFFSLLYGIAAREFGLVPWPQIERLHLVVQRLFPGHRPFFWFYTADPEGGSAITAMQPDVIAPGLTKIVRVTGDFALAVEVIDASGALVHQWPIEWHSVFPQAPAYLTPQEIPVVRPGTHVHGAEILPNGDLLFNFEHLALVRLNPCGEVIWTLPYRTHHSVFQASDGTFWVSAQINHEEPLPEFPYLEPPLIEPVILQIDAVGNILTEKPVFQLLLDNGLPGLLYTTSVENFKPITSGDILHLNDVEVFPSDWAAGIFAPGDIMISLRNANAVLVFDAHWRLKYRYEQRVVRQHDPDFMDGDHFSVFDNNNMGSDADQVSRVVIHDARSGTDRVAFSGTEQQPFFTNVLGKHQWLDNGNLLLTEGRPGRVLEVTATGAPVWQYQNWVETQWRAVVEEGERLPLAQDRQFFEEVRAACQRG